MEFNDYQQRARQTAIYPQSHVIGYPALGLAGEVGEVAEHVKKMYRDDNGILTPERRAELKKEVGDVLWYIASLCHDIELTMNEVAEANLAKLESRKERGTLHGSGSDR